MQMERNKLEGAMVARNAEIEHLKADNQRYANEWECRERSLVNSHELRIQHLLSDLTTRDKHNSELHNCLHRATVELQTYKGELQKSQRQSEVSLLPALQSHGNQLSLICGAYGLFQTNQT